jgi:hypothetical protein
MAVILTPAEALLGQIKQHLSLPDTTPDFGDKPILDLINNALSRARNAGLADGERTGRESAAESVKPIVVRIRRDAFMRGFDSGLREGSFDYEDDVSPYDHPDFD